MSKPVVGQPCSFYHQGGSGERRWVIGWRYGIVDKVRGSQVRVEIRVPRWEYDPIKRTYKPLPFAKAWIPATDVNEAGDTIYHGPLAKEVWKEHQEEKAEQQAKADKKKAARRFTRA